MGKKDSKYKQKAFERGCIRPFLYLVSMSPKRRAAMGQLVGLNLISKSWYMQFDPHREAWYIIASHRKGMQARGNSSTRIIMPFKHSCNWYMILHSCAEKVKRNQGKYIDSQIIDMTNGKEMSYQDSLRACKDPNDNTVSSYEELVMLMFSDLVEPRDVMEISKETEYDPTKQELIKNLRQLGFHTPDYLHLIAHQIARQSSNKKANEMYAWGDVIRHEDERFKKRQVAGIVGLGALSGLLLFSATPLLVAAPPLGLVPLGAGIGIGTYAITKATPGGLVAIVVGCLQQRLALAIHNVAVEKYYLPK